MDQLLQLGLSLVAVLALVAVVWWLRLGSGTVITDEDEARRAAQMLDDGFEAREVGLDRDGRAAVVSAVDGRIMVIRPHGAHYAGRILLPGAKASLSGDTLSIDPLERQFGVVRLELPRDAKTWASRIDALSSDHA